MVERFTIPRFRCEHCSQVFQTLHDATEHEVICRENRFRIPHLIGRWVEGEGVVGMATQTRKADSFIGISTPFTPVVVWVSPLKVREITLEDAKVRLSGQLEAKVRGFELKADDYRRDA